MKILLHLYSVKNERTNLMEMLNLRIKMKKKKKSFKTKLTIHPNCQTLRLKGEI